MKKLIAYLFLSIIIISAPTVLNAQGMEEADKKFSITSSADASMLQLALLDIGNSSDISTLRYTLFWNGGFDFNYKLSENVALFSGLAIKNLGVIIKDDTSTSKFRTYGVGIPLGLKIGKMTDKYFIVGGGVDFPFHYKAKRWVDGRSNKVKKSEWFSDQVNPIQPFGMIGYRFGNSLKVKAHYYPANFWNDDLFINTNANLIVLSLGFDMNRRSAGPVRELRKKKSQ